MSLEREAVECKRALGMELVPGNMSRVRIKINNGEGRASGKKSNKPVRKKIYNALACS